MIKVLKNIFINFLDKIWCDLGIKYFKVKLDLEVIFLFFRIKLCRF